MKFSAPACGGSGREAAEGGVHRACPLCFAHEVFAKHLPRVAGAENQYRNNKYFWIGKRSTIPLRGNVMNKLALLFAAAAALCATPSEAENSLHAPPSAEKQSPVVSQALAMAPCVITTLGGEGRTFDVHHPLVDAGIFSHVLTAEVWICRRRASGKIVTRAEASSAAIAYVQDRWGANGCRVHADAEFEEDVHEWKFSFLCEKPVVLPPKIDFPEKLK